MRLNGLRAQYGCPVELALEFVGGKWKTVIPAYLKDLELLGLVEKDPHPKGRSTHVYRLTPRGETLRPVLDALYAWGSALADETPVRFNAMRAATAVDEPDQSATAALLDSPA